MMTDGLEIIKTHQIVYRSANIYIYIYISHKNINFQLVH
jgi:hypothetical protein